MRLWSLDFKYLDAKGLVALWREALLAKNVLENKTRGYKNHPQLQRFKNSENPLVSINTYLHYIYIEANKRGYHFSKDKIDLKKVNLTLRMTVTNKQVSYEKTHLLSKLIHRDYSRYLEVKADTEEECCPLFNEVPGEIESWEILSTREVE